MELSRNKVDAPLTASAVTAERVTVDVARLKPLFQEPVPPLDLGSAVLPGNTADPSPYLDDMVAKLYAKRLVTHMRDVAFQAGDAALRDSAQCLLNGLVRLPRNELLALCRRPEISSWVWRARVETQEGPSTADTAERLLRYAGTFLAPVLLRHGLLPEGSTILASATGVGELHLLPLGRKVLLHADGGMDLEVTSAGSHILIADERSTVELAREELLGDHAKSPHLMDLPRMAAGPVVLTRHSWWQAHFPSSASGVMDLDEAAQREFAARLGEGLRVMDASWSEAAERVRSVVGLVMPLESQGEHGNRPYNYSVPAFRGLIMTSSRTGYLAAQTLAHETGHNRFNDMIDLFRIAHNADETFYSPFVEADRPLINLFHGVFAFLNDLHMARRSEALFATGDGPAIPPYAADITERLRMALDTLLRHARVTSHGRQLLDAFRAGMPARV